MEVMGAQRDIAAFLRFASAEVERDSLQRFQDWCQARHVDQPAADWLAVPEVMPDVVEDSALEEALDIEEAE
eukprot:3845694-Amphidinium_carterae.1